jgi:putative nucleotidyltransferase with HDIG domain
MGLVEDVARPAPSRSGPRAAAESRLRPQTSPAAPISSLDIAAAARILGAAGGGTGAAQLLPLLYDESASAHQIISCVRTQPALAARVLTVANSAYYGCTGSVGTLERAVSLLGLPAVRGIAATGCMDRLPLPTNSVLNPDRLRRHSLAVALAAESLSHRSHAGVDSEAFTAGLLHDVGIVLLARLRPQAVAAVGRLPAFHPSTVLKDEVDFIGADHATAAAHWAEACGLPGWLATALKSHHNVRSEARGSGVGLLPALLTLAERCADDAGFGLWPAAGTAADPTPSMPLDLHTEACDEVTAGLAASLALLGLTRGLAPGRTA